MRRFWPWAATSCLVVVIALAAALGASAGSQGVSDMNQKGVQQQVPSLINMTLGQAMKTIATWGYASYGLGEAPSRAKPGTVIYQDPPPGRRSVPDNTSFLITTAVKLSATTSLPAVPCAAGDPNIYFAHRSALATP